MSQINMLHDGFRPLFVNREDLQKKLEYLKTEKFVPQKTTIRDLDEHCVRCLPTALDAKEVHCRVCSVVYCRFWSSTHYSGKCSRCGYSHFREYLCSLS